MTRQGMMAKSRIAAGSFSLSILDAGFALRVISCLANIKEFVWRGREQKLARVWVRTSFPATVSLIRLYEKGEKNW